MKPNHKSIAMGLQHDNFTIFDNLLEGVQIIDTDFRYLYLNHSITEQAQQPKENLLKKKMSEAYPGIENTEVYLNIVECMNTSLPFRMENKFEFPNGSVGYFELRIQRVEFGVLIMSIDITEKILFERKLKEINERYILATNTTTDAVIDWDLSSNQIQINERFNHLLGLDKTQSIISGEQWISFIHEDNLDQYLQRVNNFDSRSENNYKIEYRVRNHQGIYLNILERGVVVLKGEDKINRIVASLIENSGMLKGRIRKKILLDINDSFGQDIDLEKSLELVIDSFIKNYPEIKMGEVWLIDRKNEKISLHSKKIKLANASKFYEESKIIDRLDIGEGIPGIAWQDDSIIWIDDVSKDERFLRRKNAEILGLKTLCGVPLKSNNGVIGTLLLGSDKFLTQTDDIKAFMLEITESLGSEIKRKLLEVELTSIFEHSPNILGLINFNGNFLKINCRIKDILGYDQEEIMGMHFFDLINEEQKEWVISEWEKLIHRQKEFSQFEFLSNTKAKKKIWLSLKFVIDHTNKNINFVAQDITKEKILKDLFDTANRLAGIGYWKINIETNTIIISDIAREILKIPKEHDQEFVLNDPIFQKWIDSPSLSSFIELRNDQEKWDVEVPIIDDNLSEQWLRITGEKKLNHGVLSKINGSIQDISDRKLNEIELKRSEQRYYSIFQSSPIPMWVYDLETLKYVQVNKNAIEHYGYSEAEFLSMTLLDLRPQNEHSKIFSANKIFKTGTSKTYFGRYNHLKKNGELIHVDIFASKINIGQKEFGLVMGIDVTEKILFENNLTKSIIDAQENERREIGQELHDNICQMLTYCELNLQMFSSEIQLPENKWLNQAQTVLNTSINELRDISHLFTPNFQNGARLSESLTNLFEIQNIEKKYTLTFDFDKKSKDLILNEQLHLNLYRIAQEQWKNITKYAQAKNIVIKLKKNQKELQMSIEDDGQGFDVKQKTDGIGLRNMKRRSELFNGTMQIESEPNKGCKLIIRIPIGK